MNVPLREKKLEDEPWANGSFDRDASTKKTHVLGLIAMTLAVKETDRVADRCPDCKICIMKAL